jgi:hypothetical protein
MNYAVNMGSGAMKNIPSLMKFFSGIQKLIGADRDRQIHILHSGS